MAKTMVNINICLNLFLKVRELVPKSDNPNLKVTKMGLGGRGEGIAYP